MKTFFNVEDLGDLKAALAEAQEVKANRFGYQQLGKNKTLLMIFFNNSLRTRLSTQKAAMNLGMNVIVLDVNAGAWSHHGWRQERAPAGGHSSDGLLLRHHRRALVCRTERPRLRLRRDHRQPVCEILWQARRGHGDRHGAPLAGFRRLDNHRRAQEDGTPEGGADVGTPLPRLATGRAKLVRAVDERRRRRLRGDPARGL